MSSALILAISCVVFNAILYGHCTTWARCPQNERFVRCMNLCNTCVDRGVCLDRSKPYCVSGCDCVTGYFRNSQGKCVPENLCDGQKCKRDEQYYANKPDCKNTCEAFSNPGIRCAAGKPGCFCKEGLVKRKDGKCVRLEDCFQGQCKRDEQYYFNKPDCKNTCENYDNPAILCLIGEPGCFCKDGLVKRKDGKCVPPEDCPQAKCGANEEYQECGTACPDTCENYGKPRPCTLQCVQGCFCKEGFVRGTDGQCILLERCPANICGANEQYKTCGTCDPTCTNKKPICSQVCREGCFCKKGFYRNDGRCVPESQCPVVQGQCGLVVQGTGSYNCTIYDDVTICDVYCNRRYEGRHYCDAGQPDKWSPTLPPCVRSSSRSSQNIESSPGIESSQSTDICGANEQYKTCGTCDPTCTNKKPICSQVCIEGCFCKKGFYRNDDGCIPESQCPVVQGQCGLVVQGSGSYNCTIYEDVTICDVYCNRRYEGRHYCDAGQPDRWSPTLPPCVRSSSRSSQNIESSSGIESSQITDPQCAMPLCAEGCKIDYDAKPCPTCKCDPPGPACSLPKCGRGCRIDYTSKPCPSCNCDKPWRWVQCSVPKCKEGCRINYQAKPCPRCKCGEGIQCGIPKCRDGCRINYENKPCPNCKCDQNVPQVQCDIPKCKKGCRINYETKPCPSCKCDQNGPRVQCDVPKCKKGCRINYETKPCPSCKCDQNIPKTKCGRNEQYSTCVNPCNDCYTRGRCNFFACNKGCACIKGYYRDENQKCIPASRCPKDSTCDYTEEYKTCGTACQPTCSNPNPRCTRQCVEGCFCREGYIRAREGGSCIEESSCTTVTNCPIPDCGPGCYLDTSIKPCAQCVCYGTSSGYPDSSRQKRDSVEQDIGDDYGDDDEEYSDEVDEEYFEEETIGGGGIQCSMPNCPSDCRIDYSTKPCPSCDCSQKPESNPGGVRCSVPNCPTDCRIDYSTKPCPSCDCSQKPGTNPGGVQCSIPNCPTDCRIDYSTKPCPSCDCSQKTESNPGSDSTGSSDDSSERYFDGESDDSPESYLDDESTTSKPDEGKICDIPLCKEGCTLEPRKGSCPECVCDNKSQDCPGKNEEIVDCAKPKWCNTCGIKGNCKLKSCSSGCDCKPGYYRNNETVCIPEFECPGEECPLINCIQGCYPDQSHKPCPICVCDKPEDKGKICPIPFCKEGCTIEPRNGSCPVCVCDNKSQECTGKNEEIVDCAKPKWCNTCGIKGNCKLKSCSSGCDCKPGYYRNNETVCIPESECPGYCGGENEEYKTCGTACQPTCSNPNPPCTTQCAAGCFCKKGYIRQEKDGKCIRKAMCKKDQCGENEVYKKCGTSRQPTCDVPKPVTNKKCTKGCFCKNGYIRKEENGPCIKKKSCENDQCGENEVYKKCGTSRQPTCDVPKPVTNKKCTKGCFCKNGYIREEENGLCIKKGSCEKDQCGKNEEYKKCGTSRQPTCDVPTPVINKKCQKGCFCMNGYIRKEENGPCIKKESCEKDKCGENEVYKKCGTSRQPTCDVPKPVTNKKCKKGCFCKNGYIRKEENGPCIKKESCENGDCGENEEYKTCGTICQPTCGEPKPPCSKRLCAAGCFCKSGYIREEKDGKCIKKALCKKDGCGENEEYKSCGTACQASCSNPNPICTQQCVEGCFCKKGYVRDDKDGECIKRTSCKKRPCPLIKCVPGCRTIQNAKNCPACDCTKPTKRPCPLIKCAPGCRTVKNAKNCPACDCTKPTKRPCPLIKCAPGCRTVKNAKNCPACDCTKPTKRPCPLIKCAPGCRTVKNAKNCPSCDCSKPTKRPCDPIKCARGCRVIQNSENCPACDCSKPTERPCDPIKCAPGCRTIQNAQSCPECDCSKPTERPCPQIRCKEGCTLDESAKPCPKCNCPAEPAPPACEQEKKVGPCRAAFVRYYYNKETGKCEEFVYGGCQGNSNNFKSLEECEAACPARPCPQIRCREGCTLDETAKPCPKCNCTKKPEDSCGPDEQYYQCKPVCNNTCENYNSKNRACPLICSSGCACKQGLVLRKDGACVKPDKCKATATECPKYKCAEGCYLDSSIKPCPKCVCYQKSSGKPKAPSYGGGGTAMSGKTDADEDDEYDDFSDEDSEEYLSTQQLEYYYSDVEESGEYEFYESEEIEDDESEVDDDSVN